MKKSDSVLRSSTSLFATPVPYPSAEPRNTIMVVLESDGKGKSAVVNKCVEDEMSKQIALNYNETCLQNLVDKGVDPHGLDMVDTQRLGVDAGIDDLAQILISNSQRFVNLPKTPESNTEPQK